MFGYTLANAASAQAFNKAANYIVNQLHFKPTEKALEDVDGSIVQYFRDGNDSIELSIDEQIGGVFVCSTRKLNIQCVREWETN